MSGEKRRKGEGGGTMRIGKHLLLINNYSKKTTILTDILYYSDDNFVYME